jgi:hypothetical protein
MFDLRNKIAIALCFALAQALVSKADDTKIVAEGLELNRIELSDNKSANYLRISLDKVDVRVLTPLVPLSRGDKTFVDTAGELSRVTRGFFLEDYKRQYNALAIISGGYIETYSPPTPLGFVKSNKIRVSVPQDSWLTNAMFCSDEGRASIQLMNPVTDRPEFRDCLQAGPMLLRGGKPPSDLVDMPTSGSQKLLKVIQKQTFACVDQGRSVILGITEEIDIPTLITALQRTGCVDAMRLTGSDTAGLLVKNELFGADDFLFPSAIGVIARQ